MALAAALLAAACSGGARTPDGVPKDAVPVVASMVILADLARNVGGDSIQVRSLIPPGADAHSFRMSPQDSVVAGEARVLVLNGAGLDDWLAPSLRTVARKDVVQVVASGKLDDEHTPEPAAGGGEDSHEGEDPHLWLNPANAIHYVERIRDGLTRADPARAEVYAANAARYIARLEELDREIERKLAAVPPQRRRLVTFHGAFRHFGERYGWETLSLVPSEAGDVSPQQIASIQQRIRAEGIKAVFVEPQFGQAVLRQLARDTGAAIGTIYSDTFDERVTSYVDLMRFNADSIVKLLE